MKTTIKGNMKRKLALAVGMSSMSLLTTSIFAADADNTAYREGYGLVLEQRWDEAREHFERFQTDHPGSAWADDAAFWQCYAIEQATDQEAEDFACYESFLNAWPASSWVSDARSKLFVLGSQLSSRGNPQYIERIRFINNSNAEFGFDFDLDFDFNIERDSDAIADTVAEAMESAQRDIERVRVINGNSVPPLPPLPDPSEVVDPQELRRIVIQARERAQEVRRETEQVLRTAARRVRNSADDELLSVLAALRNNDRAADILIDRFDNSTDAELRARIVLLLEEFQGEQITNKLIDIVNNESAEDVRDNAIVVLLDRKDPAAQSLLSGIALDSAYSPAIRSEILGNLSRWDDQEQAINTLRTVINSETEPTIVRVSADALADVGSEAALDVLLESFATITIPENRIRVLAEIADINSPRVLNFLSETALNSSDDETAAVAIAGIADLENNIAVAALEHIYLNTSNTQRRLAAIHGIGETETLQAVEVLQQVLNSEADPALIVATVNALGDSNQAEAVAAVLSVYRANTDANVQRAAIRAMRELEDFPGATDGLLEILEDRLEQQGVQ